LAGAVPQTLLGELTTLPHIPARFKGEGKRGGVEGKGKQGGGEGKREGKGFMFVISQCWHVCE